LYQELAAAGFHPWLDDEDILPGQDWENEIKQSMRDADFLLLCLSKTSVTKQGYVQTEMKSALALLDQHANQIVYLIPVRLDNCPLPKSLARKQSADLYDPSGLKKLIKAIQFEVDRRKAPKAKDTQKPNAGEIGFLITAETGKLIERLQAAATQLEPTLQSISDGHHKLSTNMAKLSQLSDRWAGKISNEEMIRRLEYCQHMTDLTIDTMSETQLLRNFLTYCRPDVGIGPANVEEVRNAFNDMYRGASMAMAHSIDLVEELKRAAWLPAELKTPPLNSANQIYTQADQLCKKLSNLGEL